MQAAGGRVVFLPYLSGRSTTSIIERSRSPIRTTSVRGTMTTTEQSPTAETARPGAPRTVGTVYVTGGSSGLGAAVVAAVAAAGGTPAVIDRVATVR